MSRYSRPSCSSPLSPATVALAVPLYPAMGIWEKIGGLPSLTAVLVMVTGVIGVVSAKYVLNFLKIGDHAVRGFSIGLAAHGMGIARAFQVSEEAGAFAGVAMTALASSILFPLLLWIFTR